jgi:hypothetical protein
MKQLRRLIFLPGIVLLLLFENCVNENYPPEPYYPSPWIQFYSTNFLTYDWGWNDTAVIQIAPLQDGLVGKNVTRIIGHASGTEMKGGFRLPLSPTFPLRVILQTGLSSVTANTASVIALDSASNFQYRLTLGKKAATPSDTCMFSLIIAYLDSSASIFSQECRTLTDTNSHTIYELVMTLEQSQAGGEIKVNGERCGLIKLQHPSPSFNKKPGLLYWSVDLVGTPSLPVTAFGARVELFRNTF